MQAILIEAFLSDAFCVQAPNTAMLDSTFLHLAFFGTWLHLNNLCLANRITQFPAAHGCWLPRLLLSEFCVLT
jgi:hypothetical protein